MSVISQEYKNYALIFYAEFCKPVIFLFLISELELVKCLAQSETLYIISDSRGLRLWNVDN
jgi:hypothetical protein